MRCSISAFSMPNSTAPAGGGEPRAHHRHALAGAPQTPGGANRLDDLCVRYAIDNSRRTKHGALLDAELLAEVYIELIAPAKRNLFSRRQRRRPAFLARSSSCASVRPRSP